MFLPEDAGQVAAYLESGGGGGPLVVWLNELYDFLGSGGLKASTVRRMLAGERPILLVGTIWPERYSVLTEASGQSGAEIDRDAREILTVLAHREHLAAQFSEAERAHAVTLARRDPRIAAALAYDGNALAGNLAAAPALIAAWQDPDDPYAHAVLAAAVVVRRCGHPPVVPAAILKSVALGRLSARERAATHADWFTSAVRVACTPLAQVRVATLYPASAEPGTVDGYEVSGILVQHDTSSIDDATWRAIIHLATSEAYLDLGATAYFGAGNLAFWRRRP